MKSWKKQATGSIRFVCEAGDGGVIVPPVPASDCIPAFLRRFPAVDGQKGPKVATGLKIKRCRRHLEAWKRSIPRDAR